MALVATRKVVETRDKNPLVPHIMTYISYIMTFDLLQTGSELFSLVLKNLKAQKSRVSNFRKWTISIFLFKKMTI